MDKSPSTPLPSKKRKDGSSKSGDSNDHSASKNKESAATPASSSNAPVFPVGPAGKRELRKALIRSTDPAKTISSFQQRHSLHTMMARAFGTTPSYEYRATRKNSVVASGAAGAGATPSSAKTVESLDTDSVMAFLSHLGVRQHEVHKRISDTLMKSLIDEIQKANIGSTSHARGNNSNNNNSKAGLLDLLKSCWMYATTIPDLRPVLWAVLKQLGEETPRPVLIALAERDGESGRLKHPDVFEPLPPLLKRLCWEADWDLCVPVGDDSDSSVSGSSDYYSKLQSTLLYEAVEPSLSLYCSNRVLEEAANHPFAATVRERRLYTKQRRALTSSTAATASGAPTTSSSSSSGILRGAMAQSGHGKPVASHAASSSSASLSAEAGGGLASSAKAVAKLRALLVDVAVGASSSYRPKLLYFMLSICMARHGSSERAFLGGSAHLHCTLVADILLSAGGPLPKAYHHLLSLAQVLDECVQEGNIGDAHLAKVQACLRMIFLLDEVVAGSLSPPSVNRAEESSIATESGNADESTSNKPAPPSNSLVRQLNRIITAGLAAMKESDPQSLFLNPVTDAIAPGYSKVISKPMSIVTMERKVQEDKYASVNEWKQDVELMFKNCIDYNRGANGQWFRGEAHRQGKVFREEIFPSARRSFQAELVKRAATALNEDSATTGGDLGLSHSPKRAREYQGPTIAPLPPANKKRKKEAKDDYLPSMPALACMLLSDPFVVRIVIARVLRELRRGVMNGSSLPVAHAIVPSLLQLLHMARWSRSMCAVRGKRYFIPDSGTQIESNPQDVQSFVPFATLRRFIPLTLRLFLEAELDRRVAQGGDLCSAAQTTDVQLAPINEAFWAENKQMEVAVSIIQGAIIFLCQPGMGNESSLSVTFPKFATALRNLDPGLCWDKAFLRSLVQMIARHKTKLPVPTRDSIVKEWLEWLKGVPQSGRGTMESAAHAYLIRLLNEWASLGNRILPRDTLVQFALNAVKAAESSTKAQKGWLTRLWNTEDELEFQPVREQYERMLKLLPAAQANLWKQQVGLIAEPPADEAEAE